MQLTFRETGMKKETRHRILLLVFVFFAGLVFFEILLNRTEIEQETTITPPTLPTVTMEAYGQTIAELHGYVTEMDALYMRDAVVPLTEERILPLTVHTYGNKITDLSYEIRSTDAERKIAETPIKPESQTSDTVTASIPIENLVNTGEEYLFLLTLFADGREVHYYTRILVPENEDVERSLRFAGEFHEKALSKDEEYVTTYIETEDNADKDTLRSVSLKSTLSQVCWGNFTGEIVGDVLTGIKDVGEDYTAVEMEYRMSRDADGKTEYYYIDEYFKIRSTSGEIYLLDYERTMDQLLNVDGILVDDNVLTIGVCDPEVNYLSNETGSIAAFVQAGELFLYDQNRCVITRLFSLRGDSVSDIRATWREHDIRLLNIDETGTMDFVVYGYMNAGSHEGHCGIDLFHYDSNTGQVKEQMFIESTDSYQIIRASFSDLLYKSTAEHFYIMVDGTLMKVDLSTLTTTELLTGLSRTMYAASKSGRYIAWMDDPAAARALHIMDLENESSFDIKAEDSTLLKVLAFMEEDVVYADINEADVTEDAVGSLVYPMRDLKIETVDKEERTVLKTYEKPGRYITNAVLSGYTLFLTLGERQENGTLLMTGEDTIKNSAGEMNKTVVVESVPEESKGSVVTLTMAELTNQETIKSVSLETAGLVGTDASIAIRSAETKNGSKYFVYVGSTVAFVGTDVTEAIHTANEEMGIVIDNTQQYIWRRGRAAYVNAFRNLKPSDADAQEGAEARCISSILHREDIEANVHEALSRGDKPLTILQNAMPEALVFNLTGCTLSEVLYYISEGTPVFAVLPGSEPVLLTGYDASTVSVYTPENGNTTTRSQSELSEQLTQAGNIFIAYVKR